MTDTELRELIERLERCSPEPSCDPKTKVLINEAADAISTLIKRRDELEEALRDTLSVCEYVLTKPDLYDQHFSQLVHAHVDSARTALSGAQQDMNQ